MRASRDLVGEQSVDSHAGDEERQQSEQAREISDQPFLIDVLVYLLVSPFSCR